MGVDYKIAVEIKSFVGRSDIDDLEKALGQYWVLSGHFGRARAITDALFSSSESCS